MGLPVGSAWHGRQAVLSLGSWTGGGQGAGALRVSPLREPFLAEGLLGPGLGRQGLCGAPLPALLRGMSLRGCPTGPKIIPVRGPVRDCPRAFPRPHIKGRRQLLSHKRLPPFSAWRWAGRAEAQRRPTWPPPSPARAHRRSTAPGH